MQSIDVALTNFWNGSLRCERLLYERAAALNDFAISISFSAVTFSILKVLPRLFFRFCIELLSDLYSNRGLIVLVAHFLSIHRWLPQQTTRFAFETVDSTFAIYRVNLALGEMCDFCTENSTFISGLFDNWNMQTNIGDDCANYIESIPQKWEQIRRETRSNKNEIKTIFARNECSRRNRNRNLVGANVPFIFVNNNRTCDN